MLKLFKDLTRPPEPLSPRPLHSDLPHTPPRAPRSRGRSPGPGSVPNSPANKAVELPDENDFGTEVEGDAKKVSELLEELERAEGGVMGYVEVLSQLNSIPCTARALHTFRRQKGFPRLISALRNGLAGGSAPSSEEEKHVEAIQRLEGLRIWFEVLGWALRDRDNFKAFDALGGYMGLLEPLCQLGMLFAATQAPMSEDPSSSAAPNTPFQTQSDNLPNLKILAHLLAHISNDNYTILSVVPSATSGVELESTALAEQLGDISLTRPRALPLLWYYLWSLPADPNHIRPGKGKSREKYQQRHRCVDGSMESQPERSPAIAMSLRILLIAMQVSVINLFALKSSLPSLPSFLMDRLYAPEAEKKYEITFPPRDDWFVPEDEDRNASSTEEFNWAAPSDKFRSLYLLLLRRLLEAGVDQALVWRLFGRARIALDPPKKETAKPEEPAEALQATPEIREVDYASPRVDATDSNSSFISTSRRSVTESPLSIASTLDTSAPPTPTPDPMPKRRRPPNLVIDPVPPVEVEKLDMEVLDLIRHSMKARWPDLFAFRGSGGIEECGLELKDMGRTWPLPSKGFNFSAWIHISKLNRPITLLQASQANQKHPLFQVRILENSQVALLSSEHQSEPAATTTEAEEALEPEETICSAPDALIAHGQWIHFAVGCRRPKGLTTAEARIFVNGMRVGAMRVPYPVPTPPGPPQPHTLNSKPVIPPDAIRLSIGKGCIRSVDDKREAKVGVGREEDNEYLLGRSLLVEDALPDDIVLLMFHLGPRYHGNFHDPLGKFLTYEAATSINVYLSAQAQDATDKSLFTSRSNSVIVKAIRQGNTIPEENILLSVSPKDAFKSGESSLSVAGTVDHVVESFDACVNAAVPHPTRAKQLRHGIVCLVGSPGSVESYACHDMDHAVSAAGGGAAVLRMIDMARSSDELAITLGILRDMLKGSWAASEEIERIRGYDLLAAILRPKMVNLVDIHCTKIILGMLGINMDRSVTATVHNSAAYRALGLEFELWSRASLGVVTLYLQHFEYLLATSKHARYNVLRTFQKAAMVRKMLYALRSGLFDLAVVPVVVDTLKLVLIARWSGEDAIKPIFSFLVSSLCQSSSSVYPPAINNEPPPSQAPAAQILAMIAGLSHNGQRLVKLTRSIALHRLLVIFISSNSAPYVITPCLDILERCLLTSGLESFQRLFEAEGGFALLARTLGALWTGDMQARILRMLTGPVSADGKTLQCPALVSTLLAALDCLLQSDDPFRPSRRGSISSIRSVTMTPLTTTTDVNGSSAADDTRLEDLFRDITALYRTNSLFRRAFTSRRVEQMLPAIVDFAAMTTTSSTPDRATAQRAAAAMWLQAIVDKHKISHSLINQIKLVIEQLRSPSAPTASASMSASLSRVPSSPRPSSAHLAKSFAGSRFGGTPPGTPSPSGPIPRRRISTDAAFASGSPFSATRMKFTDRKPPALKRVLTGESILEGGRDKNAAWKLIIIQTDSQSHSKMVLERKEHWRKLSEVDWPRVAAGTRAENGLWPEEEGIVQWRLDGSEGPLRMRNRLERIQGTPEPVQGRMQRKLRDAIPSVDELSSAVSVVNLAPWEDPFALALGQAAPITEEAEAQPLVDPSGPPRPPSPTESRLDDESFVEVEENKDDKMRRIAKTLQAGDVVEEAHNVVRIIGVDACPGLLILGKKNLYLVDGLVQTSEGEVIDAKDAPRDVLTIPGTMIDTSAAEQESLKWPYSEVIETNKRAFLFRDVALELYFSDKRNFLVVFKDKRERQGIVTKLQYKTDQAGVISRSFIGNFVLDQVVRAIEKPGQDLDALTRKWQTREISNFAYLSLLNQYANRTPNDVTQYPVFPWVLADYTSPILDLTKASSFRDLSLPMGALTPARKEAAVERYSATEGVGEKPFHYGTHYSSSMIVCGFLIRLSPFTEIFLALQGGNFDLADRLFSSVARAWDSASADNRGDVRELIPEFYYSSAFFVNLNHHDFGRKQVSGDSVDNVVLPPWALGDPLLVTHKHREALESDFVSRHLPVWIDLTFGYKQRDPAAYNCFHPLSYRGGVDLEHMEDESELAASTAIIHNFGQTPVQIFKTPHPVRYSGRSTLPFGQNFGVAEQWQLLIRSRLPITETVLPIDDISIPSIPESKPAVFQRHRLAIPGSPLLAVHYGFTDESLRILYSDIGSVGSRIVHIIDGVFVVHAVFATPSLLVTVSWDSVITVWRLHIKAYGYKKGDVSMQREATLRGHMSRVTCLAASTSWSFLVSCSENGNAMIWDMNRLRYTRTIQIPTKDPIKFCSINESDGQIAIATATHLFLYSLNGHPIASTRVDTSLVTDFVYDEPDGSVFSDENEAEEYTGGLSFLKREFLPFGVLFVVGIGREVALYRCVPGVRRFADEEDVPPWQLIEQGRLARSDDHDGGNCCMVKFAGETLYAAFEPSDENAKYTLYQWSLPEGSQRHVPESVSHACMAELCGRHFGLLEPKRYCGGCGGAFCGTHAVHVETLENRYCADCRAQLGQSQALLNVRRDSAIPSSRRGSMSGYTSGPSSRRQSFGTGVQGPSSRRPSVSRVLAKAAIAASAMADGNRARSGTLTSNKPDQNSSSRQSREATPLLAVP